MHNLDQHYLSFFLQSVPENFHEDTLFSIGGIMIALAYPDIEIYDSSGIVLLDCHKLGLSIKIDSYPIMRFLKRYPEFCKKIVYANHCIKHMYDEFLKEKK